MAASIPPICLIFKDVKATENSVVMYTSSVSQEKIQKILKNYFKDLKETITKSSWEDLVEKFHISLYDPEAISDKVSEFLKNWNDGHHSAYEIEQEMKFFQTFFHNAQDPSFYAYTMSFSRSKDDHPREIILAEGGGSSFMKKILPNDADDKDQLAEVKQESAFGEKQKMPIKDVALVAGLLFASPVSVKLTYKADIDQFYASNRNILDFTLVPTIFPWRFYHAPTFSKVGIQSSYGGIPLASVFVDISATKVEEEKSI